MVKQKVEYGQVFTPKNVAALMAKLLNRYKPCEVLDPGVGTGILLEAIKEVSPSIKVKGFDVDEDVLDEKKESRYNIELKDFFDYKEKVDAIIMNPPYIRQEKLLDSNKEFMNKDIIRGKLENPDIPKKANLYLYFFYKALKTIRVGQGVLVAIMPSTWLTSTYGVSMQEIILKEYTIDTVINFYENIFKGHDVDVSIFVIRRKKPENNVTTFFDIKGEVNTNNVEQIIEERNLDKNIKMYKVLQKEIVPLRWYSYRENSFIKKNSLTNIGELFLTKRGITTNSNSFFIRNSTDKFYMENKEFFKPIINKARDITGYSVRKHEVNKYLFTTVLAKEDLPPKVKLEINKFEKLVLESGTPKTLYSKVENKPSTWHTIDESINKSIIFNYIIRDEINFYFNNSVALVKDNFYEMSAYNDKDMKVHMAILNSTFTKCLLELSGRSYGTGLLKIQKYELDRVEIINPKELTREHYKDLERIGEKFLEVKQKSEDFTQELDYILSNYYLNEGVTLEEFYEYFGELKRSRKGDY